MSIHNGNVSPRPASGDLWYFWGRDRAITSEVLGGVSIPRVARVHGLSALRIHCIVRKTCERLTPGWVDGYGLHVAWSMTLEALGAVRGQFGI